MEIKKAGSQPSDKGREWAANVYRPDIVNKLETLYKKPGYEM